MARSRFKLAQAKALDPETASMSELKKAYTAMRDVFQKQVGRLAAGTESQREYAAPFMPGGYKEQKKLSEITGRQYWKEGLSESQRLREMRIRVQELQQFIDSPRYSLSGWREIEKRTLKSLNRSGYTNITKGNLRQFGAYMEAMRDLYGEQFFPSAEVAEAYDSMAGSTGKKITSEQLGKLMMDVRSRLKGGFSNGVDIFA